MTPEFRAWDKEAEVMRDMNELGGLCLDALVESDFILEQYTGLKDVNGNKIFEGDIVRNEHEKTRVVNFKEGSFLVGAFYFGSIGAGMDLEIIGNIHENPELLEVEK